MSSTAGLLLLFVLLAACRDDNDVTVEIRAEVIEPGAPVSVQATAVREAEDGQLAHGVRVEWRGADPVRLDDARFTHHVEGDRGHLVTAGRGCGADWEPQDRQVVHICTLDLQLIELRPGQAHEYPVRIYPRVGPLRLAPGTYVVEQVIEWWRAGDFVDDPLGRFTLRLTYEVS